MIQPIAHKSALITFNLQGVITGWDKDAEQIYGYNEEEALHKYWLLLVPQEKYDELSDILQKVKSGEYIEQLDTIRMTKDGNRISVRIKAYPQRNSKSKICGLVKIVQKLS